MRHCILDKVQFNQPEEEEAGDLRGSQAEVGADLLDLQFQAEASYGAVASQQDPPYSWEYQL